ncbi:MAG: hypothetical protein J6Y97_01150 [Prevotella sp.]|nr:hypothetical protein [Prevotella sp.]MBP5507112.1 hypothetical protein [Prevotella sp.]
MEKQQIQIEHSLLSTSPNIIWNIISTEGGLSRWIADSVKENKGVFSFTWGSEHGHHETRKAALVERVRHSHIRLRWEDETDQDAYLELRMVRTEITGGYILHITDYAFPDDVDSLYDIWDQNLDQLRRSTGL